MQTVRKFYKPEFAFGWTCLRNGFVLRFFVTQSGSMEVSATW